MKFSSYLTKSIELLFYSLFLLVPLVFAGNTSELFEFNKMWLTFGITVAIGFAWFSKMIIAKKIIFRRTIFDIPILLFLISQVISTLISMDQHVSFWGYYSRWNGGLLSTITYIFLFYAFVSNFLNPGAEEPQNHQKKQGFFSEIPNAKTVVRRSLLVSLISGLLVVLWALPSHFGYDPTCLMFRGTFDVSCWTADFVPTLRIFGPLGQPDWLAVYLGILLPVSAAFAINELREKRNLLNPRLIFYGVLFVLFYISLLYTGSRSGIIGGVFALIVFFLGYAYINRGALGVFKTKLTPIMIVVLFLATFFAGIELPNGTKFSYADVVSHFQKQETPKAPAPSEDVPTSNIPLGGSSSLKIRSIVWKGGLAAWKSNPIFGTGVETYAFAYYKHRPVDHNSVSEWNFLYNKAHNEYLNYLVTTGAFGLLSYLSFIGLFLILSIANLLRIKIKPIKYLGAISSSQAWDPKNPLLLALLSSFIAMLIINFFGFSVVMVNIYLFLIPAFVIILLNLVSQDKPAANNKYTYISYAQWTGVAALGIVAIFLIYILIRFWIADTKYALGYNYNQAREFQTAYQLLHDAAKMRKEPVFLNELAANDAFLAVTLAPQASTDSAQFIQGLAQESVTTIDKLTKDYPNNVVYWKTKVRILYSLANIDPQFYAGALAAVQKTAELAPTDASVLYNLGVLYGQNGDSKKAVEVLEKTISYRPHYAEAHFALGLFYHDLAVNPNGGIKDKTLHDKAKKELKYILKNLNPNDAQSQQYLEAWNKEG